MLSPSPSVPPPLHPAPPTSPKLSVPRMKRRGRTAKARGDLRDLADEELRKLTGDDEAGMWWTLEDYVQSVVLQHGYKLVGWPADVPFTNLSYVRGGVDSMKRLEDLWELGILRFVQITTAEWIAASLDPANLAPAPTCAHRKQRGGREDIGRARYRYKTNPYNLPLRRPKPGPKTPKYVPAEWDMEEPTFVQGASA